MSNQGAPHQPAAACVAEPMEHAILQVCTNSLVGQSSNYPRSGSTLVVSRPGLLLSNEAVRSGQAWGAQAAAPG